MPLFDHFRPPFDDECPWEGFHSDWATKIADQLNAGVLPSDYRAIPLVSRGRQIEIDVATLQRGTAAEGPVGEPGLAVWTAPAPAATVPVDFEKADLFEVQVVRRFGGRKLRAAVELLSPSNKDRPSSRRVFITKCASYLNQGVSLVLVDVVTERLANLHTELIQYLQVNGEGPWQSPTSLYTVSYHLVLKDGKNHLEMWREPLAIGSPLPTMPLWLEADYYVPLDLETSYTATLKSLRLPP